MKIFYFVAALLLAPVAQAQDFLCLTGRELKLEQDEAKQALYRHTQEISRQQPSAAAKLREITARALENYRNRIVKPREALCKERTRLSRRKEPKFDDGQRSSILAAKQLVGEHAKEQQFLAESLSQVYNRNKESANLYRQEHFRSIVPLKGFFPSPEDQERLMGIFDEAASFWSSVAKDKKSFFLQLNESFNQELAITQTRLSELRHQEARLTAALDGLTENAPEEKVAETSTISGGDRQVRVKERETPIPTAASISEVGQATPDAPPAPAAAPAAASANAGPESTHPVPRAKPPLAPEKSPLPLARPSPPPAVASNPAAAAAPTKSPLPRARPIPPATTAQQAAAVVQPTSTKSALAAQPKAVPKASAATKPVTSQPSGKSAIIKPTAPVTNSSATAASSAIDQDTYNSRHLMCVMQYKSGRYAAQNIEYCKRNQMNRIRQ